ncbi:MAG: thermonuclease family protein [Thermoguttaceae bacterium]|nr:thermonuclease family protein [Thermoguttaceae bacterium]MDW8078028.1 thermonuclease family protein [Thermoguttaceae bacterium]
MPRRKLFRRARRGFPLPRWIWLVVLGLLIAARLAGLWPEGPPVELSPGVYSVSEVVDGDTLRLINGARIRLIGVDAPEMAGSHGRPEPGAEAATQFVRQLVDSAGGQVRLEFDRILKDQYGRFLAYVYAGDIFVNEELLRQGLARSRLEFNFSSIMKTRFRQAEESARQASRGIWQLKGEPPTSN